MFFRPSSMVSGRGVRLATVAFGASLPLVGAAVADVVGCLRARAGGYSYPGTNGVCTAYTKCPTIIFCKSPGTQARSAGIVPNTATACADYLGGTWAPVAGHCTGGKPATTTATMWVAIPVDTCVGPCMLKAPINEEK